MIKSWGATVIDNVAEVMTCEESLTWTVKLNAPAAEGTPKSEPVVARLTPDGRAPEVSDQL